LESGNGKLKIMAILGYQIEIDGGAAIDVGNVLTVPYHLIKGKKSWTFRYRTYNNATPRLYSAWSPTVTKDLFLAPSDTPTIQGLHVEADLNVKKVGGAAASVGDNVDKWIDNSANAWQFTDAGGSTTPAKLINSTYNHDNLKAIKFDGTRLTNSSFNLFNNATKGYWILAMNKTISNGVFNSNANSQGLAIYFVAADTLSKIAIVGSGQARHNARYTVEGELYEVIYDGSGATDLDRIKIYRSGIQQQLTVTATIPNNLGAITPGLYLGCPASGEFLNTECFGLEYLTDIPDPATRQLKRNYWIQKYYFRNQHHIYCQGDSLTHGLLYAESYPKYLADLLNANAYDATPAPIGTEDTSKYSRVENYGVPGNTFADNITLRTGLTIYRRPYNYTKKTVMVLGGGSNDIASENRDATYILSKFAELKVEADALGIEFLVNTILPRTDITGTKETNRNATNTALRSTYGSRVVDWALWADGTDAPHQVLIPASGDGIHLTATQNQFIANLAKAKIDTL
jgi:hypothetical protein